MAGVPNESGPIGCKTLGTPHEVGVLTVRASDTRLRAMLQGWMDQMQKQWLDSAIAGV